MSVVSPDGNEWAKSLLEKNPAAKARYKEARAEIAAHQETLKKRRLDMTQPPTEAEG